MELRRCVVRGVFSFAKFNIIANRFCPTFPGFAPVLARRIDVKECKMAMGELPPPKWQQPMTPAGPAPVVLRQKTGKWTKYSANAGEGKVTLDQLIFLLYFSPATQKYLVNSPKIQNSIRHE